MPRYFICGEPYLTHADTLHGRDLMAEAKRQGFDQTKHTLYLAHPAGGEDTQVERDTGYAMVTDDGPIRLYFGVNEITGG